ncbi:hypothetical protein RZS08_58835, partial [Arthrospira platensis SPKY1]|nr:hypothetical protein [Arthrospira platensis SPKY1]
MLSLSWTVKNIGNGTTGSQSWYDHIWLSTDDDLRLGDDILLAKIPNLTYLHEGESYSRSFDVQLPQTPFVGNYLVFVSTDNDDAFCASPGWECYPGVDRGS